MSILYGSIPQMSRKRHLTCFRDYLSKSSWNHLYSSMVWDLPCPPRTQKNHTSQPPLWHRHLTLVPTTDNKWRRHGLEEGKESHQDFILPVWSAAASEVLGSVATVVAASCLQSCSCFHAPAPFSSRRYPGVLNVGFGGAVCSASPSKESVFSPSLLIYISLLAAESVVQGLWGTWRPFQGVFEILLLPTQICFSSLYCNQNITTDWMQKMIWEYGCLLLS